MKPLYALKKDHSEKIPGARVYHVNVILRFTSKRETRYERIRLVLNRDGIKRIEPVSADSAPGRSHFYPPSVPHNSFQFLDFESQGTAGLGCRRNKACGAQFPGAENEGVEGTLKGLPRVSDCHPRSAPRVIRGYCLETTAPYWALAACSKASEA